MDNGDNNSKRHFLSKYLGGLDHAITNLQYMRVCVCVYLFYVQQKVQFKRKWYLLSLQLLIIVSTEKGKRKKIIHGLSRLRKCEAVLLVHADVRVADKVDVQLNGAVGAVLHPILIPVDPQRGSVALTQAVHAL